MAKKFLVFLIIGFLIQAPIVVSAKSFPKVLSCVKAQSESFDLHLVTLIDQNANGTGRAYVNDKYFRLVLEDGIWLGTSERGTEFLILESDNIKIVSGKDLWEGVCFKSDDALTPLVETVSQPLSVKIERLTKELHKLKSELALVEIENSRLIEKIEQNISDSSSSREEFEVYFKSGMSADSMIKKINSTKNLTGFIEFVPEEGTMATGKFSFKFGESREKLLSKIMLLQRANLGRAWLMRSRNTVLKSPRDLLILASILEKETVNDSEKQLISSVFHNRLKKGMKLQADPTVLYGLTLGKDVIARSPTKKEIQAKNPYNTYVIKGLPITPISNPSVASLFAAARPSKTDFLYFVSNGNGGHRFSKTYDGHKEGIEILLTRKREQRKSSSGSMTYVKLPPAKPVLLE
ncbi:endolytic transglycosylase MltG [Paracoccaceae bacterium]|nr:endolytic transglycosylase MltG [Paracoccaceae bacterium]